MSKKKKTNWLSGQKLLNEMELLPIEELQDFEESIEGKQLNQKQSHLFPANSVEEETHKTGESSTTKEELVPEANSQEKPIYIEETPSSVTKSPQEEANYIKENPEKEEEAEKMTDNQENQALSRQETIVEKEGKSELLSHEIKELMVENEGLQVALQKQTDLVLKKETQLHSMSISLAEANETIQSLNEQWKKQGIAKYQEKIRHLESQVKQVQEDQSNDKQEYERKLAKAEEIKQQEHQQYTQEVAELTRQLFEAKEGITLQQSTQVTEEEKELQEVIDRLREENAALQVENEQFQTEISEVLVFARRKANRTVQEAKIESERMVRTTEMRIDAIHDRAKEILFEVSETKDSVIGLFDDLNDQVHQLSDKKLLFEEFEK